MENENDILRLYDKVDDNKTSDKYFKSDDYIGAGRNNPVNLADDLWKSIIGYYSNGTISSSPNPVDDGLEIAIIYLKDLIKVNECISINLGRDFLCYDDFFITFSLSSNAPEALSRYLEKEITINEYSQIVDHCSLNYTKKYYTLDVSPSDSSQSVVQFPNNYENKTVIIEKADNSIKYYIDEKLLCKVPDKREGDYFSLAMSNITPFRVERINCVKFFKESIIYFKPMYFYGKGKNFVCQKVLYSGEPKFEIENGGSWVDLSRVDNLTFMNPINMRVRLFGDDKVF